MFEGIPVDVSDSSRLYRGFIAVDGIKQNPGSHCRGFCTFAAGFCDWGNEQGDDFDWDLVSSLVFCGFRKSLIWAWAHRATALMTFCNSY
jgi:hypothetical protein